MTAALAAGCALLPSEDEGAAPILKTPKPITYNEYKVERGDLYMGTTGVGRVASVYYTKHAFETAGAKVKAFHVTLGDTVRKGDILVELDNTELEEQYIRAKIAYEREQIKFEQYTREYNAGTRSALDYRLNELDFQSVERDYQIAEAAYENTVLYAKESGVVVYLNTAYSAGSDPDKTVVAGETMVAIDNQDKKYLYVEIAKDAEAANDATMAVPSQFGVGAQITLTRTAGDGTKTEFQGKIVSTSTVINDTGLSYVSDATYYCQMIDPPRDIQAGDAVSYTYVEASSLNCLQVPVAACHQYNGRTFVYMLDSNNLKKEVYIETGLASALKVEVKEGLSEGDIIILG